MLISWPIGIRDPLPEIPVPLRSESYATLDLQEILHHVYDHGTYADEIYESNQTHPARSSDQEVGPATDTTSASGPRRLRE